MADEQKVDIFISGAGPVGLLLTYQLLRLNLTTHLVDAADKASPAFPMLGRASTLYPRTLELLDQLDLYDDLAQVGLVARRAVTFKEGKRVHGRGWTQFENFTDTYFDFSLNVRLKYSEDIFRRRIGELGGEVHAPVRLVGLELDEDAKDDYKVTATCSTLDGKTYRVKAKYIVGCDGGSSAVRKLAGIPFEGEDKEDHWVRIDGKVKTNMPDSRVGFGALESKTHGNVLFVALDHGATRIGYVLSPEMYERYGRKMSKEDAIREAKAAVAPFELEFETVEWHTVYGVKQHVAARLQDRERIFLAGDAAHTHSSGSAQGMNTGTHDAVSLGWRLAGVLNGWYTPEVLATYTTERKATAEQLIENDRTISALISQHKPGKYKDREEDTNTLLVEFMQSVGGFSSGLGIEYAANILNNVEGSSPPWLKPGQRFPDVSLQKNGLPRHPVRFYDVCKNEGKFHVVVFTGDVHSTGASLKSLRGHVDKLTPQFAHAVDFRTVVMGQGIPLAFEEYLGVKQFGDAYWDMDHSAHTRYKVSPDAGEIVVLRPDGILGFVAELDGFELVAEYLGRLIVPRRAEMNGTNGVNYQVGEHVGLDENNLYYQQAQEQAEQQGLPESTESGAIAVH
ncbi:uncharacterized protein LTR77_001075 [Saxophila tyrrhenica]|uniref:FAD-binding domain-containing protein n=1 Tax=Saxophila tyrrhenica TaxID=1690608 RepID=A0AAV9PML5_9PEZI|nr:hypothetical protein LTR77_001075 [Saxophila tyrrhenica]